MTKTNNEIDTPKNRRIIDKLRLGPKKDVYF